MSFFNFFRKEKKPPKEVIAVYEQMKNDMEGKKMADKAISYRNLGEYDQALKLLRESYDKYGYAPALTLIGTTALLKGKIDDAINWFELNVKTPPKGSEFLLAEWYGNLGTIYLYKKEDARTAVEMFEHALNTPKPDGLSVETYEIGMSSIYRDAAVAYLIQSKNELALKYAKKRLSFDPDCQSSKKVVAFVNKRISASSNALRFSYLPPCDTIVWDDEDGRRKMGMGAQGARIIHAMGHIFLYDLYDLMDKAARANSREQAKKDAMTLESWAKVVDGKWTIYQEENFVRQYELYMLRKNVNPAKTSFSDGEILEPAIIEILDRVYKNVGK